MLNTGEARRAEGDAIIMGAQDVLRTHRAAPTAHMEALNHCVVTREEVRSLARDHGIADRVHAPTDGERLEF